MNPSSMPDWLAEAGGVLQLERAAKMLRAAPLPGQTRARVSRLIARHEAAIRAQGSRGFQRQHDPVDPAPWRKLREHVQYTLEVVLSPEQEPGSTALLRAFELVLRLRLEPRTRNRTFHQRNVSAYLRQARERAPKVGTDADWLWRLDVLELVRRLEQTVRADTAPELLSAPHCGAAQARKRWSDRWIDLLLTVNPAPVLTPALQLHLMGRLVRHGWTPVRVTSIDRGVPQQADEPDLAPMLAWHWSQKRRSPVQALALDLNTLMRGLTADPAWRSDRALLGQILARIGMFLCDEVGPFYADPVTALAGKVLRCWHAAGAPRRREGRPSDTALEALATTLEAAGFTAQTVRAFQVGYPPFDSSPDPSELLQVVRLELEVNLDGGYTHDRVSVEFATLDVLSALAAVEASATQERP